MTKHGTGQITWDWTTDLGLDKLLGTGRLTWDWTTRPWPAASSCSPPDTSAPAGPPRPPGSTPGRPSRRGDVSASSRQRHPSRPSLSPSSSPTENKGNFRDIKTIYKRFYAVLKVAYFIQQPKIFNIHFNKIHTDFI